MLRKLVLCVLVVAALLAPASASAAKEYAADRFDVDVRVQQDGSLLVTETIVFSFTGGPFTYVFRDLPADHTDGITQIAASLDGESLPRGTGDGQVEVKGSDPVKVTWHFAPTSDASHTFGLTYQVLGVIRRAPDSDLLVWQVLPDKYEYPIRSSTTTITYPDTTTLAALPEIQAGNAQAESGDGQVRFLARDLTAKSPLVVALRFKAGSIIATPPAWQVRQAEQQAQAPGWIAAAAAIFIGLVGALAVAWSRSRPPRRSSAARDARCMAPPDDLPPAVVGTVKNAAASIAWPQALATLLDLARRGVIIIEESSEHAWYRKHEFVVALQSEPGDLRPHERGLLALMFDTRSGRQSRVKLSDLSRHMSSRWKRFADPLKQEMRLAGLISPDRERTRRNFAIAGSFLLAVGVISFATGLIAQATRRGWAILAPLSLIGAAVVAFVMSAVFPILTDAGLEQAARWKPFERYLNDVARGRDAFLPSDLFDRYFPYAATYGLAEKWAKTYGKQSGAEIPGWFRSLAAAGTGTESMGAFVVMMSAANSAGSGGGAGAAGAGAAGGGASGAG